MKIILSIKPEFANKIFEGEKKFEFRRSIFKNKNVSKVIVYASSPISKVIGEFEIGEILFKDLNTLWKETKDFSGITEDYFYDYFVGKENGFALEVKRVIRYKKELCIKESFGKTPPQSFVYYEESMPSETFSSISKIGDCRIKQKSPNETKR
jgi:predicted transcriptional regulator